MTVLSRRFRFALDYAAEIHASQIRKGTDIPYISHLLTVAAIVLENGGNEDEAIAALLHDAVEDGGGQKTYEEIRHCFGEKVAEIVAGCTDAWTTPKPPWRERKEAYISHIKKALPSVLLVSVADKFANARSMVADYKKCGDRLWTRFNTGKEGQLWYLRTLVIEFAKTGAYPELVAELDEVVTKLERVSCPQSGEGKTFVGIDGCKAGWVLAVLDGTGKFTHLDVAANFGEAVERTAGAALVLIDIPIGLRDAGSERACDKMARNSLGARRSSLFPVPVREAVHAATYGEACRINAAACGGRKLSKQTWAICNKIAEVDDVFTRTPALQSTTKETHPEICFTSLNSWIPMSCSKKTQAGQDERLAILQRHSANAETFFREVLKDYPSSSVLADDIIDAMACAIVAREGDRNGVPTIPPEPEVDRAGLKMEMVCAMPPRQTEMLAAY